MSRALLLAGVVLALGVSSASAHTTIIAPPEAHWPYQQWVDEAKVPTPDQLVTVAEHNDQLGDCDAPSLACTDGETIWVVPWLAKAMRWVIMHEVGHIFALRTGVAGFYDERFADSYASCAIWRIRPGRLYGVGEGEMRGRRLARTCQRIKEAA